jgi:hypothetical protein
VQVDVCAVAVRGQYLCCESGMLVVAYPSMLISLRSPPK